MSRSGATKNLSKIAIMAMQEELLKLRDLLTREEKLLMLDALNGQSIINAKEAKYLPWEIEEAIKYKRLDKKWGVNKEELINKLRSVSIAGLYALYDLAQRSYQRSGEWTDEEIDRLFSDINYIPTQEEKQ